jgi:hypothetical protein
MKHEIDKAMVVNNYRANLWRRTVNELQPSATFFVASNLYTIWNTQKYILEKL